MITQQNNKNMSNTPQNDQKIRVTELKNMCNTLKMTKK